MRAVLDQNDGQVVARRGDLRLPPLPHRVTRRSSVQRPDGGQQRDGIVVGLSVGDVVGESNSCVLVRF